jgi:hypothetical protein
MDIFVLSLNATANQQASRDSVMYENPHWTRVVVVASSPEEARTHVADQVRSCESSEDWDFPAYWLSADHSVCMKVGTAEEGHPLGVIAGQSS